MVKVSVIIPIYNVEKYLPDCLDSVLSQSLRDIEVVCVDDGSTDGSGRILEAYRQRDSRIIVVPSPSNSGAAIARNRGLEQAGGKYIYFVDADDMLKPGALDDLCSYMECDALDGLLFNAECQYEKEEYKSYHPPEYSCRKKTYEGIKSGAEMFAEQVRAEEYNVCLWQQFWNREYLLANNIQFPSYAYFSVCQDIPFSFQALLQAKRVKCLTDVFYVHRMREGSTITKGISFRHLLGRSMAYMNNLRFMQTHSSLWSSRIMAAVSKHLKDELLSLGEESLAVVFCREDIEGLAMQDASSNMLLYGLLGHKYQHIEAALDGDMLQAVRGAKKIIVYGAGVIGQEVIELLRAYRIENYLVAVSRLGEVQNMKDKKVHDIHQLLDYRQDCLVLIAATKKYHAEMKATLDELGFNRYVFMM